jgi:nitrite reductase/ring-hydroxylating ferredoxin subunit
METQEASTASWMRLCEAGEVASDSPKRVEIAGLPPLAVFKVDGEFFVTDDTCTHGEASLADGYVDGDRIECPWHAGRFCIRTGAALEFPAVTPLTIYKVKVEERAVYIDTSAVTGKNERR